MVGFEGVGVGGAEGGGELVARVEEVGADALGCEVEAAGERWCQVMYVAFLLRLFCLFL